MGQQWHINLNDGIKTNANLLILIARQKNIQGNGQNIQGNRPNIQEMGKFNES